MPKNPRSRHLNSEEARGNIRILRHIVADFFTEVPALSDVWQQIDDTLADILNLTTENNDLRRELFEIQLDQANLAAAGRATIAAYHDGEPDPLSYLRHELNAQGYGTGGGRA